MRDIFRFKIPSDYPEIWKRWTKRFRGRGSRRRVKALRITGKALMVFFALLYLLLGWGCAETYPGVAIGFVVSTILCFIPVQIFCAWRNEPRPYEAFDMKVLVTKKDRPVGGSFPSRTVFCAFAIAGLGVFVFRTPFSVLTLVLAVALACVRVLEGVSFPRDVLVGASLGLVAAGIGAVAMIGGLS